MEMKHLGSTLRLAVYVPGPQVPGLTEQRAVRKPSMCVRYLRVSAGARAYTVYMTGRDPGGGGAM